MKNFRLLFVCAAIFFLDLATPFSACSNSNSNKTILEINVQAVDNALITFEESNVQLNYDVTTITERMIQNKLSSILNTGSIYSEDDLCSYEVQILSYEVESFTLIKNDGTEIEIELPYTFSEEDIIVYSNGKRNFLRIIVNIKAEYNIDDSNDLNS